MKMLGVTVSIERMATVSAVRWTGVAVAARNIQKKALVSEANEDKTKRYVKKSSRSEKR